MWRKLLQDADNAGLLRPHLDPMGGPDDGAGARSTGPPKWAVTRAAAHSTTVVRTAQSLVRHGLGYRQEGDDPGAAGVPGPASLGRASGLRPADGPTGVRLTGDWRPAEQAQTASTRWTCRERGCAGAG